MEMIVYFLSGFIIGSLIIGLNDLIKYIKRKKKNELLECPNFNCKDGTLKKTKRGSLLKSTMLVFESFETQAECSSCGMVFDITMEECK